VTHRLNREVYRRFDAEGIAIPYPQRDVTLHESDPETEPGSSPDR